MHLLWSTITRLSVSSREMALTGQMIRQGGILALVTGHRDVETLRLPLHDLDPAPGCVRDAIMED